MRTDTMILRATRVSWEYRGRSCLTRTGAGPRQEVPVTAAPPAAEMIPPGARTWLASCDATASGSEDAQVRLARGVLELSFCGHHADRYELALLAAGWRVIADNRGGLA